MPAYRYEALDADGKALKGLIEADTARAARGLLRAQALVPLSVEALAGSEAEGGSEAGARVWLAPRVFNATTLAIWTRQLAGLVAAGLPLERALSSLAEEGEDER